MDKLRSRIKETALVLSDELRKEYPYVYPETGAIDNYVKDCIESHRTPSVHMLYDYLLSHNLCEVEE